MSAVVIGADAVAAGFATMAVTAAAKDRAVAAHYAAIYLTKVKARASGRPGPNVITGDYRRSWMMELTPEGWVVFTNKPQGPRLEWGFVGTDSLGRSYHQPPFPHVEPDLPNILEQMAEARLAAVGD